VLAAQAQQRDRLALSLSMAQKSQETLLKRVYVGSLAYELNEDHVRAPFSVFGTIIKVDMPRVRCSLLPCWVQLFMLVLVNRSRRASLKAFALLNIQRRRRPTVPLLACKTLCWVEGTLESVVPCGFLVSNVGPE